MPSSHDDKFYRVELSGATDIQVSIGTPDPFPDTVSHFDAGENGSTLVPGSGKTYTVWFKTTGEPIYLEWTYRTAKEVRRAARVLDLALAANGKVEFTLTNSDPGLILFDADGNGTPDVTIEPSADLRGGAARDVRPPKLKYSGELLPIAPRPFRTM